MLSKNGSQDDVSIAGVFNTELAKPILPFIVQVAKITQDAVEAKKEYTRLKAEKEQLKQDWNDLNKKLEQSISAISGEQAKIAQIELEKQQVKNEKQKILTSFELLKKELDQTEDDFKKAQTDIQNAKLAQKQIKTSLLDANKKLPQSKIAFYARDSNAMLKENR